MRCDVCAAVIGYGCVWPWCLINFILICLWHFIRYISHDAVRNDATSTHTRASWLNIYSKKTRTKSSCINSVNFLIAWNSKIVFWITPSVRIAHIVLRYEWGERDSKWICQMPYGLFEPWMSYTALQSTGAHTHTHASFTLAAMPQVYDIDTHVRRTILLFFFPFRFFPFLFGSSFWKKIRVIWWWWHYIEVFGALSTKPSRVRLNFHF